MTTIPVPSGLTPSQIAIVTDNAAVVRAEWRARWLVAVADLLVGRDLTDDDVTSACQHAYALMVAAQPGSPT